MEARCRRMGCSAVELSPMDARGTDASGSDSLGAWPPPGPGDAASAVPRFGAALWKAAATKQKQVEPPTREARADALISKWQSATQPRRDADEAAAAALVAGKRPRRVGRAEAASRPTCLCVEASLALAILCAPLRAPARAAPHCTRKHNIWRPPPAPNAKQ